MTVAERIVALLAREGAEHIVGFPENRLLDAASIGGLRPIITRTERVAVNIADGYARATLGEKLLPCVMQYGPGAEAAFAAVAQAYGDRSPILLLPGEHATTVTGPSHGVHATEIFRPITR
jgi:acetolactate synthase-1/2/3 large subunit